MKHDKPPLTDFLKPFGCLVYVFTPKEKRAHKINGTYRDKKIYIGSVGKHQILVADPSSLKVTRHRYVDCKFYVDKFPRCNNDSKDVEWKRIDEEPEIKNSLSNEIDLHLKEHLEMKALASSREAKRLLPQKNRSLIPKSIPLDINGSDVIQDKNPQSNSSNDAPTENHSPSNLRIDMNDKMIFDSIFNSNTEFIGDRTRAKRRKLNSGESDSALPAIGLTDSTSSSASAQAETSDDRDDDAADTLSLRNDKESPNEPIDPLKGANSSKSDSRDIFKFTDLDIVTGSKTHSGITKIDKSRKVEVEIPYRKVKHVSFSNGMHNTDEASIITEENNRDASINMIRRRSWYMRPATAMIAEVHSIVNELDAEVPKNWKAVLMHPYKRYWLTAMETEIGSLITKGVWEVVDKPIDGRLLIGCRWVFALKKRANGEIERYKARLVAQGFSQEEGIDYDEIYSPVIRQATLRYILSFCMSEGLEIELADIETAFLYGDIDRILYMKGPPGDVYKIPEGKCLRLKKAIYGLKQAGRQWFVKLSDYLKKHGFVQGEFDKCIFIKRWTIEKDGFNDVAIIGVYVDDLIIGGSKTSIKQIKELIFAEFKGKALGKIAYMLGIIMDWKEDDKKLYLHQRKYITEILKKFRMDNDNVKVASIPIQPNVSLYGPRREDEEPLPKNLPYRSAIGALFYLLITRPDISFAMSVLSQHCENPTMRHWKGVLQVMRYLKGTLNLGLKLNNERGNRFYAYSDASYNLHHDAKGQGGYVIYHNENPISYWSGKQRVNGLSSTDDEIFALNECVRELKALYYTSNDLMKKVELPIIVFVDSQPCIKAMQSGKRTKRNKHLEPRLFYVHDLIDEGFIKLEYIKTKQQAADIFTKALGPKDFIHLRDKYFMTILMSD